MSSIIGYENDNKLRKNRLYDIKSTMMNEYTRSAIYKRTNCLDKFGFSCVGNNAVSCATPYISSSCPGSANIYSNQITSPPIFTDKFYKPLNPVESSYDINVSNLNIRYMTKTNYYNAITAEQTRTNSRSLISGIKGPIEFILRSQSDPEQTIHYWSTDNWTTTNEFVDKQQQDRHVFVTLKLNTANYKSGVIDVQAYSVQKGLQKSAITTHRFNVSGYNSIGTKPENGTTIPYYIEYLANWFDVNPLNTFHLYPPVGADINNPFADFDLSEDDQELLANYITWLKQYAYTGPTSNNRDKLTIYGTAANTTNTQANTFIYGTTSISPVLTGAPLDQMITSKTYGWLPSALTYVDDASITGGEELRIVEQFDYTKIDFRMNGDDVEYKTVGIYRVKRVTLTLNLTNSQLATGINEIFAYDGFTITGQNTAGGNIVGGNIGSIEITSQLQAGSNSVGTWEKLVCLRTQNTTNYRYVKHVYEVIGMINTVESIYQIETPRPTDMIWKRYIMTGKYTGQWLTINYALTDGTYNETYETQLAINNYTISQAGVLGVNYEIRYEYTDNDGNYRIHEGITPPENVNVWSSTQIIKNGVYTDVKFGIVGYILPNTQLKINFSQLNSSQYNCGLRGIGMNKYCQLSPVVITNNFTGDVVINFYGEGYSETNPNPNSPQGFENQLFSVPGIQSARDLIGWTITRVLRKTETNEDITVTYKICDTFNNEQNDINNFYISFATVNSTNPGDSNYTTHIINVMNPSAGIFLNDDILKANGFTVRGSTLVCPRSYSSDDLPTMLQKPFNYHPDTKSVIVGDAFRINTFYELGGFAGGLKVEVVTQAYMENPADSSLLGDGKRKILKELYPDVFGF